MADMQETGSPSLLNDVPLLPSPIRAWAAPAEAALRRWVLPLDLMASLERAQGGGCGTAFACNLLEALQIQFEVDQADFLFVSAADAPSRNATVGVASAGFLADFDEALFGLRLGDVAIIRIRHVS